MPPAIEPRDAILEEGLYEWRRLKAEDLPAAIRRGSGVIRLMGAIELECVGPVDAEVDVHAPMEARAGGRRVACAPTVEVWRLRQYSGSRSRSLVVP